MNDEKIAELVANCREGGKKVLHSFHLDQLEIIRIRDGHKLYTTRLDFCTFKILRAL